MYIMSIDQGTTGTTVSILDQAGSLVAKENQEYPQIFPKPGWVEHNPEDIWASVVETIQASLQSAHLSGSKISAIGITNQRETVMAWDRNSGKVLHNAIVWQCRRTESECVKMRKAGLEKEIRKKTGLVIDPYFSGTKIKWLLQNVESVKDAAKKGTLCVGTVDTFVLWRLTGGRSFCTDVSNASRTMLMNITNLQWDKDLCKFFQVPLTALAEIKDSSGEFGKTQDVPGLPNGIPISGIAGDQQAALFGQTAFAKGDVKCTFGTGSFILMNTGNDKVLSKHKMLTTVAWKLPKQKATYALEGGAFVCGAAVQWLRDGLGLITKSSEVESLAKQVTDSGGVEFVPALTGLGAPHWKAEARGILTGLTRGTTKAHIARATLEAMALQNVDILVAMENDLGKKVKSIKVDGGASANSLLMQLQADFMNRKVIRPELIETTAIGAAYLAGLGVGFWSDLSELQNIWKTDKAFDPQIKSAQLKLRRESWEKALRKTMLGI